jgi:hypothetical protein
VLDYLLPEMENLVGTLVVAMAGYPTSKRKKKKEKKGRRGNLPLSSASSSSFFSFLFLMIDIYKTELDTLFEYNEGLPSRFPVILSFNDFTDKQLLDVFLALAKKSNFKFPSNDVKYARIAARDLGRLRGTKVRWKRVFFAVPSIFSPSFLLLLQREELPLSQLETLEDFAELRYVGRVFFSVFSLFSLFPSFLLLLERSTSIATRELGRLRGTKTLEKSVFFGSFSEEKCLYRN